MNIPLELVDVLNWKNAVPIERQPVDKYIEASVDHFISNMHPVYGHVIQFGIDYHNFMDNNDPAGLLEFIDKYKNDGYWRLARFANGLQMDLDAVRNTLLYPDISNGMTEGTNNMIKCIKRVRGGKANIDLLTAIMLIRQLNKTPKKVSGAA